VLGDPAGEEGESVVGGPADAEVLAAGAELADQQGELAVVGVASGLGAQQCDGVVRIASTSRWMVGRTRFGAGGRRRVLARVGWCTRDAEQVEQVRPFGVVQPQRPA